MSEDSKSRKRKLPPSISGIHGKIVGTGTVIGAVIGNDNTDKKSKTKLVLSNTNVSTGTGSKPDNKTKVYNFPINMTNPISLTIPSNIPVKYCINTNECMQCCIIIQKYIDTKPNE